MSKKEKLALCRALHIMESEANRYFNTSFRDETTLELFGFGDAVNEIKNMLKKDKKKNK